MRRPSAARIRLWWERAFWVIPTCAVLAAFPLQSLSGLADEWLYAEFGDSLSIGGATTLLASIGGGMVTFTGFVFSFVLLVLQFGSSQYSPRTVPYFMRARSTQWILAIFLLTITYCFLSLLEIGSGQRADFSADASVVLAVVLLVASLLGFIQLLNKVGSRVRVDEVVSRLGRQARRVLERRLGPLPASQRTQDPDPDQGQADLVSAPVPVTGGPDAVDLVHTGSAGQVIAIPPGPAARAARRSGAEIIFLVRVGDSVGHGVPIARVRGSARDLSGAVRRSLVVDVERSLRHDPVYLLRLLVDIALRALSPGVNDPTTAVRTLDEIEAVLRVAASRELGPRDIPAGAGRVVIPAATWADVVDLGLLEIISVGCDQPQVTRRLRAMLADLTSSVPDSRIAALRRYDVLLDQRVRDHADVVDVEASLVLDRQGIGGSR
jgi:uncharacterized membrane protein